MTAITVNNSGDTMYLLFLGSLALWLYLFVVVRRRKLKCVCDVKMNGKTVLITGASDGLGKETALDLAARGARIIMTCRDSQKGRKVKREIERKTGNDGIVLKYLDLADLGSVRKFTKELYNDEDKLDVLINNAGIGTGTGFSKDGYPILFATNQLGPFLLTMSLLDLLRKSTSPRVVFVASIGHHWGKIDFDTLEEPDNEFVTSQFRAYTQSKLASVLTARELHKREHKNGISVFALQPGTVFTGIFRDFPALLKAITFPLFHLFLKTADEGSQTQIHCSLCPGLEKLSGKYFAECREQEPVLPEDHEKISQDLWQYCEKAVGLPQKRQHPLAKDSFAFIIPRFPNPKRDASR